MSTPPKRPPPLPSDSPSSPSNREGGASEGGWTPTDAPPKSNAPGASATPPRGRPSEAFTRVSSQWLLNAPSEQAMTAVVMPELPQAAPHTRQAEPSEQVHVWVVSTGSGVSILPADTPRPSASARMMRLVPEELDDETRELLARLKRS